MDLSYIDYLANFHPNIFRRALPTYKLLFTAVLIVGAIILHQPLWFSGIYLFLLVLIFSLRLPVGRIWFFSLYPLIFSALFIFATFSGWEKAAIVVLKVGTISLSVIFLIVTTPYPKIFHALGHFLPAVLNTALYLTYRSIFIFVGLIDNLKNAIRLRGGLNWRRPLDFLKNLSAVFGFLFVRALDLSEALADSMRLRGFEGKIHYHVPHRGFREIFDPANALVLSFFIVVLGTVICQFFYPRF